MALTRKRASKSDFVLSAGIQWRHKMGSTVWDGVFEHPKYESPIICRIEKTGSENYKWSYSTPGPDVFADAGTTEGLAFWYAADDVRTSINKL